MAAENEAVCVRAKNARFWPKIFALHWLIRKLPLKLLYVSPCLSNDVGCTVVAEDLLRGKSADRFRYFCTFLPLQNILLATCTL